MRIFHKKILDEVAVLIRKETGYKVAQLREYNRAPELVEARVMLARTASGRRVPATVIGEYLNRDHSSILHLLNKAKRNDKPFVYAYPSNQSTPAEDEYTHNLRRENAKRLGLSVPRGL